MEATLQLSKQSRPLFAKVRAAIILGFVLAALGSSLVQRAANPAASQRQCIAQGK
jgi:hypothetical protein